MLKAKWPQGRKKTKILSHEHTGRVRSHQHTSYGGLLLITFLAMLPILFTQHRVEAGVGDTSGGGSYQTYASVRSLIPTTAPQITNLPEGRVFTTNDSFNVSGTCQSGMIVKLFKNGVLAGSTACKGGTFSLAFDLFIGANIVTARAYSADNIAGPESAPINVKLVPGSPIGSGKSASSTTLSQQFFLTSDAYYRGVISGKSLTWLVTVVGGQAPYQINVSWGDGQTDKLQQGSAGQFKLSHVYQKPPVGGNYNVVIQARDQLGSQAMLQLVAIVPAGAATSSSNTTGGHSSWFTSQVAFQSLATVILIVLSFWVGERYELKLLKHQQLTTG
jgi:hypothetical protein